MERDFKKDDLPLELVRNPGNKRTISWLHKMENYDFSDITSDVKKKFDWSQEKASETENQVKQFMALAVLDPGYYHIPEIDVDEYWHRMILHTQWYAKFCDDVFGSFYHHTPEPDPDHLSLENRERTLRLAEYWYGFQWKHLVLTCTQSQGPIPINLKHLAPTTEAMPNF